MKNDKRNEKRALIVSLSLAAIAVGGATFAWFTSQDQVTNRLSAEAEYDVSITESFTPPSNWTPGQDIKKEVKAVNTGNMDSLVKLTFGHSFTVTGKGEGVKVSAAATEDLAGKNAVDITFDKAKATQAGGYLVYNKDTVVSTPQAASADPYTDNGLYLFRREIEKTTDSNNKLTTTKYEFDGYYRKGTTYYRVDIADGAITMNETTGAITAVDTSKITIPTVGDAYVYDMKDENSRVTWTFVKELAADTTTVDNKTTDFNAAKGIRVTYAGANATSTDDDIVVYVAFNENAKTNYTYYATDKNFYYDYVLPAGQETKSPLIDSVTLGVETKESAYIKMDYDLDVILNSIQATVNEQNKYTNDSANSWLAGSTVNGQQGNPTVINATNGNVTWNIASGTNSGTDNGTGNG